jgi:hypothetical protein
MCASTVPARHRAAGQMVGLRVGQSSRRHLPVSNCCSNARDA